MGEARGCEVLIRCDGGATLGLGHVKRCLALAQYLGGAGLGCHFAGRYDTGAAAAIESEGFAISSLDGGKDEAEAIFALVRALKARAVLFDIRTDLGPGLLSALRGEGVKTVTLDDASPRRLAADIAILPPTGGALGLEWTGFTGEALIGWAWTVLAAEPLPHTVSDGLPVLLVTMGGADPQGLTLRAARLLRALKKSVRPLFVVGAACADADTVAAALARLWPGAEILLRPASLAPAMAQADFALVAYGVSAQELAAAGVPALYLALNDDHQSSAEALAATGAGHALGLAGRLSDAEILTAVARLLADSAQRQQMSVAGRKAMDGKGAQRLAQRIAGLCQR